MLTLSTLALWVSVTAAGCSRCTGPDVIVDPENSGYFVAATDGKSGVAHAVTARSSICSGYFHQRTTDAGMTWLPPVRIDQDPVYQACAATREVTVHAAGSGRVYVAFIARANGTGPETLVVKVSNDQGATWPASVVPVTVLQGSLTSRDLGMLSDVDGRAWLFWLDGPTDTEAHLYVSRSGDGGSTWGTAVRVDTGVPSQVRNQLSARLGSSDLVVLLRHEDLPGGRRARFVRSDDEGASWSAPVEVDGLAAPGRVLLGGILAFEPGQVMVSWTDDRDGIADVYSRVSLDGGRTWTEPVVRMDEGDPPGSSASGAPILGATADGALVVAAWVERRDGYPRMYGNVSRDGGRSWGQGPSSFAFPLSASATDGFPVTPALNVHPEAWVTVAWRDAGRDAMARCGTANCPAAYVAISCDGGRSFDPDRRVLDETTGVKEVALLAYPGATDGLVYHQSTKPSYRHLRLDGPTVARPLGPTRYCVGADPLLEALAVSSACSGGLSLQWYVDGAPVPGATGATWQPALAAGDHRVEVRGQCLSDPTCAPDAVPLDLHVVAPQAPPGIGNTLRAVRNGAGVVLDWTLAPPLPDVHAHVRRSDTKGIIGTIVAPDPLAASTWIETPPAAALWLYGVRRADLCEAESAD